MRTVLRINEAAAESALRVGSHQVGSGLLPILLQPLGSDSDESYRSFAADVRVLADAAAGLPATPGPALDQMLRLSSAPDTEGAASAQTAILCADQAATSRNPQHYFADIEAHRDRDPLYGPLLRNITPCSFWPSAPVEPPTAFRNDVPALLVGSTGDPAALYRHQRSLHRTLTASRLVTLPDTFRHGVYSPFNSTTSACVDSAVDRYLLTGALPPGDTRCEPEGD
ncbi:hypothetical protein AR457_02965 [Streptomyces agglomeratus]|uniref:Peptidase S33 tripeptidyl aminopeptidase-like C-terminal domain-containing protein n=1 Tax=Streptomyces agglomeratus TaxID=285458 RepID=A0A1E5P230_9ACTN|nr:alpha/beta hydrolase [Streptomyces agglomeratus]OEJ23613.1 hypothetical protein AS594_03070 [Streptomyces agglomeratus]OEJ43207.1 hypothetical protein AR457_02965 [Streptomyces agglomeratus]OEJ54872.1 hypothetical protein BGK72_32805 [Streptomyces agglomeratus]OEJ62241.1 hypothetical protein BGM19_33715 [Streptomyces agglomeratus]